MSDLAIKVENLSKRYRIGLREELHDTFGGALISWVKSPLQNFQRVQSLSKFNDNNSDDIIWALRDVSFEVKYGEVLGIIGRNGAGKSTLLKILCRITEPTAGKAIVNGRVASLLEVGTGFHPELTGRENIYLNGTILGMKKLDIDKFFDEIVDFSGVEKFIDTPVKRYSSGMRVRLAFAVAAHLDPEVLLIDEVLAVGDLEFQSKCLGKMGDISEEGRTVLFVSHNIRSVKNLCKKCIWIDDGQIRENGDSSDVIIKYVTSGVKRILDGEITSDMHIKATGHVYFRNVKLFDSKENIVNSFFFGDPIKIVTEFEVINPVKGMRLAVTIWRIDGTLISVFQTLEEDPKAPIIDAEPGQYQASVKVQPFLMPGEYTIGLGAKPAPGCYGSGMTWDIVEPAIKFYVKKFDSEGTGILEGGLTRSNAVWDIRSI